MTEAPAWQDRMRRNEEFDARQAQEHKSGSRLCSRRSSKRQEPWPPPPGLSAEGKELRGG
jgi:hypothetical protein